MHQRGVAVHEQRVAVSDHRPHIVVPLDSGPVAFQHIASPRLHLGLTNATPASSVQTQVHSTAGAEQ